MTQRQYLLLIPVLLAMGPLAKALDAPLYSDKADARRDIAAATLEAGKAKKNVVLIFGANW